MDEEKPAVEEQKPAVELKKPAIEDNMAGALAYLVVPAIVFLAIAPYNTNKFIRFHAVQGLLLSAIYLVFIRILAPLMGHMGLWFVVGTAMDLWQLAMVALSIFCMAKAYNKETYPLPVLGTFAQQYADKQ